MDIHFLLLRLEIAFQYVAVGRGNDEQVTVLLEADVGRDAITAMTSGKSSKNGMLNLESSMFSGTEKSLRTPPDDRGVDARSYVGSRSMTVTGQLGSRSFKK